MLRQQRGPDNRWPRDLAGTPVVPAEWLGRASGNQDGAFFMDALTRHKTGRGDPRGTRCIVCGFICEAQHTVFLVPDEFARFARYKPKKGATAQAHLACAHALYRGRYDTLRQMIEEGVPHDEMLARIKTWPWTPEEAVELEAKSASV